MNGQMAFTAQLKYANDVVIKNNSINQNNHGSTT